MADLISLHVRGLPVDIREASRDDAEDILRLQKIAYKSEGEIYKADSGENISTSSAEPNTVRLC